MLRDAILIVVSWTLLMLSVLALVSLLPACRAQADDTPSMGSRWVGPVEQPEDMRKDYRCDLYRGNRDWPAGIGCHPAVGDAEATTYPPGETMPMLTRTQLWQPAGLDEDFACAEWRYLDAVLWSACYPRENP